MEQITLSQGQVTMVDDEDYDYLNQWKWYFCKGYAYRNSSRKNPPRRSLRMHRIILNAKDGEIVDHISGNRLDNRRSNLRFVNGSQSNWNAGLNSRNKSGFKGVSLNKKSGKWVANIHLYNRQIYLGRYDSKKEAAVIYNKKAKELFGEYARLNNI